jgi:glutamyl-tRNA synthetase/glutamyl-Q tRNA(Asp) synthetase
VNAIYVWGLTRALGGRVLLRIEDHDRVRSRPEYEAAILEDLEWLGFTPDDGLHPVRRQRDTGANYEGALRRLHATHHVYACDCSRRVIAGEIYSGRCRDRGLDERPGRGVRVQIGDTVERFDDLLLGPIQQTPADQCGDILLKDRDGNWTYQFAVTVDDLLDGVTLVIRGADLVTSTGRQIALARMLGRARPPVFLHHPLIVKPGGEKLSKASGDSGVRELRRAGIQAPEVVGRAAAAVGLIAAPRAVEAARVDALFTR